MAQYLSTHAVESAALWIAEGGLAYEESDAAAMAYLRRINEGDGWTVETSAPLGGVIRYEGVHLSETDLRAAYILGTSWLADERDHRGYQGIMTVTEARARALRPERHSRAA